MLLKTAGTESDRDGTSANVDVSACASSTTVRSILKPLACRADVLAASALINLLSLGLPIAILQIYDRVIPSKALDTFAFLVAGLAVVILLDAVTSYIRAYITNWSAARLQHALGIQVLERTLGAGLAKSYRISPGMQIQRYRAVEVVKSFYAGQAALALADLPFVVLFLALIAIIAGPLVIVPSAMLLIAAALVFGIGQRLRATLIERTHCDDRRYNFLTEVLGRIKTVKALGLETLLVRRYERLQASSAEQTLHASYEAAMARSLGGTMSQLTMIATTAVGSLSVIEGALSVGALSATVFLAGRVSQPMLRAFGLWMQFQAAQLARSQVDEVLHQPIEARPDLPEIGRLQGHIELRNVGFRVDEGRKTILAGINLEIAAGETIGLTGPTGGGKSTLLNLISGLYSPTEGEVLLDGRRLQDHDPASVRRQICRVPQNAALFNGTILENMTMFREGEIIDRALDLSERLGVARALARSPDGYQTKVGDGSGDALPGGIRQRISIIRALASHGDPKIILFNDANATLDSESDRLLLDLLREYQGRATLVIVSHRPSFLKLADRNFVIKDGTLYPAQSACDTRLLHERAS